MNRILLIDDDEDFLNLLSKFLEDNGYEVESISKTSEVFPKIAEMNPNVILLDIHLSGFDGRDICKSLKSHESTKNIPVIIVSSDSSKLGQLHMYGADDFIEKPFHISSMLETIRNSLDSAVASQESEVRSRESRVGSRSF